jgi:pyruvate,water dikinase
VTVDATHGVVLEGAAAVTAEAAPAAAHVPGGATPPVTATKLLVNLSEPSQVERAAALPVDGVGLLRAELMVIEALGGVHPRALLEDGREEEFVRRMSDASVSLRPASRRGRSPTGRSTSPPTSSAGSRAASASSRPRRTR